MRKTDKSVQLKENGFANSQVLLQQIILQDNKLWNFYRVNGFFEDFYPRHNSKIYEGRYVAHPMHGAYLINRLVAYGKKTKDIGCFELAHTVAQSSAARMEILEGGLCFFYHPGDGVNRYSNSFYSGLTQCRYLDAMLNLDSVSPRQQLTEILHKIALSVVVDTSKGGVLLKNKYGTFIEEYPSSAPKYVLNGWLTSLNILTKYSRKFGDSFIRGVCEDSALSMCNLLSKFDMPERLNSAYSLTSHMYLEVFSGNRDDFEIKHVCVRSGGVVINYAFDTVTTKKDPIFIYQKESKSIGTSYCGTFKMEVEVCAIDEDANNEILIKLPKKDYGQLFLRVFSPVYDIRSVYPVNKIDAFTVPFEISEVGDCLVELKVNLDRGIVNQWARKPIPFGKKIGGVNYNVYHFIHINCLAELFEHYNHAPIKSWLNKWSGYANRWDTLELYSKLEGVSLKPYYPVKQFTC